MASPHTFTVRPTHLDDADILAARQENATLPQTIELDGFSRRIKRWWIGMRLYGRGPARRKRVGYIFIGPPASGKSHHGEKLAKEIGAIVIDCDRAKEMLPEFSGGRHAACVHDESDSIMNSVYERTLVCGGNFVRLLVGCNCEKIEEMLVGLLALDYEMHLRFVHLDPERAAERAVKRFRQNGRFVDPSYVLFSVGNKPAVTYDRLKNLGGRKSCETINQSQE